MDTFGYYWNPTGGPLGTGAWEKMQGIDGAAHVTQTDNGITLVDDTGTYVYIGKAASGTATSAATWKIRRVTSASGNTYPISAEALGTWDNRASETYA